MAQWNRKDRMLFAKLVYYGPAFGGKTTNLEALHRITDPDASRKLLSVQTSDDRTLFFDLLPFDLGDILGYQVALKLYTVPGQVRYETTRQVVLSGADAVVFVADSSAGREEQNRWSLQNLKMNMRAKRLDPGRVPLIFQFNKQDLEDAAPPDEVARWHGLSPGEGFPAVATRGEGVLETFVAASRAMLERIVENADDRTRKSLDAGELGRQVDRAFAPFQARLAAPAGEESTAGAKPAEPIVVESGDLLQSSVETSLELGERLSGESARARRLEREADAYRSLSESLRRVGPSFDRGAIVDSSLAMVADILNVRAVSLIRETEGGPGTVQVWGLPDDPLLAFEKGRALARRMLESKCPCVADDLAAECGGAAGAEEVASLRAVAAVPVEADPLCALLVYAPQPDGRFEQQDVRFLGTVAGHLSVGLEQARLHAEVNRHREELERLVEARTEELRSAYDEQRGLEQTKDRFLTNLSHEMKTPLTAILSAAVFLRDYKSNAKERGEMAGSIVNAGEQLQGLLDDLFHLVTNESETRPPACLKTGPQQLVDAAMGLENGVDARVDLSGAPKKLSLDLPRVARAVASLLSNAAKFSPEKSPIELKLRSSKLEIDGEKVPALTVSVLDRGPGVPKEDRERIFAPFEQGGDQLTGKPSGIGVGLHQARLVARQHGGDLQYHPRRGGGSEFRFVIPARPPAREALRERAGA
jgi:signal transduction histidine kinase/signal recognition particle receptor subunit beta